MRYSKQNTGQQAGSAADEAAIRDMTSDYTAAVAAGDLQRFLSIFSDDVVVMPPDHPTARGRDAFTAF
ncbi:MAG: nuclear transport factor 2 family protein, partial [Gemmatimonadota bacterium]